MEGAGKCMICRWGVGEAHPPMAHGCVGCLGCGDCGMCSMDAGVRAGRIVWEPADALDCDCDFTEAKALA